MSKKDDEGSVKRRACKEIEQLWFNADLGVGSPRVCAACLEEQSAFVVVYEFSERDHLQKNCSDHQDSRGRGVRDSSKMLKNYTELEVREMTLKGLLNR